MEFQADAIDHVEVFVSDIAVAQAWYAKVLGLTETRRWQPEPVMVGAGGTQLALFQARAAPPRVAGVRHAQPPYRWHRVAWRTSAAGFAAAQAHLQSLGISFRGPMDHGSALSIYFTDPHDNPLEITTYELPPASLPVG